LEADAACKKLRWRARPLQLVELCSSAGARGRYSVLRAPGAIVDDPVFAKMQMGAVRADVPGVEEDESEACEDETAALRVPNHGADQCPMV
jgi:hypothetical protein